MVKKITKKPATATPPAKAAAAPLLKVRKREAAATQEYDYDTHGAVTMYPERFKFVKPEFQKVTQIITPGWDKAVVPFTFRVFPSVDPETGAIRQYRKASNPTKFTDWFWAVPVAKGIGLQKTRVSFIAYDPRINGYDPSGNPYNVLFTEFHAAIKAEKAFIGKRNVLHTSWFNMKSKSGDRDREAFKRIAPMFLMQGAVYSNGDNLLLHGDNTPFGLGPKDRTHIIALTANLGDRLLKTLNLPNESEDRQERSKVIGDGYKFGDITDLAKGRFVSVYHHHLSPFAVECCKGTEFTPPKGDDGSVGIGYSYMLHKAYQARGSTKKSGSRNIRLSGDLTGFTERIGEQFMWWDDLLHFPCHEEVCATVASAFADAPDIIRYAWREHREFLTEEVKGILAARTSGPGGGPEDVETEEENEEEVDDLSESDDDDDEDVKPSPSGSRRSKAIPPPDEDEDDDVEGTFDADEDDDDDVEEPSEVEEDEDADDDDDDDDDDVEEPSEVEDDDDEVEEPSEVEEDDDDVDEPSEVEEEEEEEPPPPVTKPKPKVKLTGAASSKSTTTTSKAGSPKKTTGTGKKKSTEVEYAPEDEAAAMDALSAATKRAGARRGSK